MKTAINNLGIWIVLELKVKKLETFLKIKEVNKVISIIQVVSLFVYSLMKLSNIHLIFGIEK